MRTTLGFRQEEFIQNGEMKVTLKEQNADHSGPASVRSTERDLELKNFALRQIRCKKEEPIITGDSKR